MHLLLLGAGKIEGRPYRKSENVGPEQWMIRQMCRELTELNHTFYLVQAILARQLPRVSPHINGSVFDVSCEIVRLECSQNDQKCI